MDSIITHLILYIQYLHKIIYDLILFISKNIPLRQMSFDDSNSPKYQKFKADKYKYKLHYIYREFNINFFKVNLYSVSKRATTLNFKKFNPHIMGLALTYHVNLKLSTRKTAHALKD